LAYRYENGLGVPKDETRALDLYQKAASQGHREAQNNLDATRKK
jgi:TPR repeat protein